MVTAELASLRVDQVGSLLRPQRLKDAFADYGRDKISEDDLKRAQDEAIRDVVDETSRAQFADRRGRGISPDQLYGKFCRRGRR